VLACTHYAFVRDQIQAICGAQVNVIDPAPAIARQTARLADATLTGAHVQIVCSVTGDAQRFAATAQRLGFGGLDVVKIKIE
jgi:glutamate racemase